MKRMKIAGLALVAAVVMSVAVSSASANAGILRKAAVGGPSRTVEFKGTLGAAFLEGEGGTKITCKAGTAVGEVTGATTTASNITKFTGCEVSGVPCENAGAGEIDTKVLAGTLGGVTATSPVCACSTRVKAKGETRHVHVRRRFHRGRREGLHHRLAFGRVR